MLTRQAEVGLELAGTRWARLVAYFFIANAWARRAWAWALLLALGAAIVAVTPLLPIESRWIGGLAVAASCLALNGPVRRFAERLVYPRGDVSVADLSAWRRTLQSAETAHTL